MSISSEQSAQIHRLLSSSSFFIGKHEVWLFNLSPYLDETFHEITKKWITFRYSDVASVNAVVGSTFPGRTHSSLGLAGNVLKINLCSPERYQKTALGALVDGYDSLNDSIAEIEDLDRFRADLGHSFLAHSVPESVRYYLNPKEVSTRKGTHHLRWQLYRSVQSYEAAADRLEDAQKDYDEHQQRLIRILESKK